MRISVQPGLTNELSGGLNRALSEFHAAESPGIQLYGFHGAQAL